MKSSSVEESASTMLVAEDLEGSLIAATVFEADDDDPLVMWFAWAASILLAKSHVRGL